MYIGAKYLVGKFGIAETGEGIYKRIYTIPPITVEQFIHVLFELSKYKSDDIPFEGYVNIVKVCVPDSVDKDLGELPIREFSKLIEQVIYSIGQDVESKKRLKPSKSSGNIKSDVVDIGYAIAQVSKFYGLQHSEIMKMNILHFNNYIKWMPKIRAGQMYDHLVINDYSFPREFDKKEQAQAFNRDRDRFIRHLEREMTMPRSKEELDASSELDVESYKRVFARFKKK